MKIGIITLIDGDNYGNRLQNYALQQVLEGLGFEAETLRRITYHNQRGLRGLKRDLLRYRDSQKGLVNLEASRLRAKSFKEFNKSHIKESTFRIGRNRAPAGLSGAYDYFLCGSDQLWNPLLSVAYRDIRNNFAMFAQREQRVSYAASFGISALPSPCVSEYREYLSGMKAISVREAEGARIVRDCCGRDAEVLVDPTMLLNPEEWGSVSRRPAWLKGDRFILTYFLGSVLPEQTAFLEALSKERDAEIISLKSESAKAADITDLRHFAASPSEFLWLVSNCQCMLTDSFHGTVFSILFEKPFSVYDRIMTANPENDMSSRIRNLLELFQLSEKRNCFDMETLFGDTDTVFIKNTLKKEREKSIRFLSKALKRP